MANSKLSVQQELFVKHVIDGKPQSEAYKLAGYKTGTRNSLDVKASQLLRNPKVSLALSELRNKIAKKTEWNVERLVISFENIFKRSMQVEAVLDHEGNSTGEYRYDSTGANKALENIAKIIGAYKQTDTNTIVVNQFMQRIQNHYGVIETEK